MKRLVVIMHNDIHDRGMIKWQPFDSLTSSKKMCYDILKEKNKKVMPTLSEDQINVIIDELLEAYYNQETIKITYYYNGSILDKINKIKYIDKIKKEIILDDSSIIYFKQILKISNNL